MPLPASWVDALFAKLMLRYGAAFMRQYPDLDPDLVKADWADVMAGFQAHPESIRHALDTLPTDKPPTALQFRAMCRLAPAAAPLPQITDETRADPARVAALMATVSRPTRELSMAQQCEANILRVVHGRGGAMSGAQKHQLETMRSAGLIAPLPVSA